MSNYYLMECYGEEEDAVITRYPSLKSPLNNWVTGCRWAVQVPTPLVFEIDEEDKGQIKPMYHTSFLLMRDDLIEALRESGVDNLDCYDAVIRETENGREYHNFKAVNIVGLVSCADPMRSEFDDLGLDTGGLVTGWFERLALDEDKIRGLLLFRLAEKTTIIVAADKVRQNVQTKGIEKIEFYRPDQWPGA